LYDAVLEVSQEFKHLSVVLQFELFGISCVHLHKANMVILVLEMADRPNTQLACAHVEPDDVGVAIKLCFKIVIRATAVRVRNLKDHITSPDRSHFDALRFHYFDYFLI